ncbi:MAG: hypothetical protein ACI84C_002640 [Flavobacteriales bacterium]|jgi:hypothetical protein
MFRLVFLSLLVSGSLSGSGQTDVVDYLKENQNDFQFKYVSESMIRAVCVIADSTGSFAEATKDVRRIVYFDSEQDAATNSEMLKEIDKRMNELGFEELMTMSNQGQNVKVASLSGKKEVLGIVLQQDTSLSYLEVVGMVDLQKAIQMFSDPTFQDMVGDFDLTNLIGL